MSDLFDPTRFAAGLLVVCLLGLGVIALMVVMGARISYETYRRGLYSGAVAGPAFGAWTLYRIAAILTQQPECYRNYRSEVVVFVIFWLIVPPLWFFLEYFAFDSEAVPPPARIWLSDHLESRRVYADYASKIWAALAALLLGVAAIVFQK